MNMEQRTEQLIEERLGKLGVPLDTERFSTPTRTGYIWVVEYKTLNIVINNRIRILYNYFIENTMWIFLAFFFSNIL